MSASRQGAAAAARVGSASTRLARFWRGLPGERKLAALAALGLFVTLFLPWYQETVIASGVTSLRSTSASLTGWGAFSFVEAAVLLVAAAVLVLLFIRAEGGAFHVPGGDGGVITAAGVWTCALIIWRMFDKQGTTGHGQIASTWGIEWGIFVALGIAALLTYAGSRIRQAHEPEPPLPGEGVVAVANATVEATGDRFGRRAGSPAQDRSRERARRRGRVATPAPVLVRVPGPAATRPGPMPTTRGPMSRGRSGGRRRRLGRVGRRKPGGIGSRRRPVGGRWSRRRPVGRRRAGGARWRARGA